MIKNYFSNLLTIIILGIINGIPSWLIYSLIKSKDWIIFNPFQFIGLFIIINIFYFFMLKPDVSNKIDNEINEYENEEYENEE